MEDETNSGNNARTLLKAAEVARRLNISKALAYQLMATGEIPTVRIRNKIVRVTEPDLEAYILSSRTACRYAFPFDAKIGTSTLTTDG